MKPEAKKAGGSVKESKPGYCVGKTNSDMLKYGRNMAKIKAQKRG